MKELVEYIAKSIVNAPDDVVQYKADRKDKDKYPKQVDGKLESSH